MEKVVKTDAEKRKTAMETLCSCMAINYEYTWCNLCLYWKSISLWEPNEYIFFHSSSSSFKQTIVFRLKAVQWNWETAGRTLFYMHLIIYDIFFTTRPHFIYKIIQSEKNFFFSVVWWKQKMNQLTKYLRCFPCLWNDSE